MKKLNLREEWMFVFPILVLLSTIVIAFYFPLNKELALGITADLIVTAPLLYLGLIYHRNIPKTTVVPVLILGVVIGHYILPLDQQFYLSWVEAVVLPLIESVVLGYVLYQVYQARKIYQTNEQADFYSRLLMVTQRLFPGPMSTFMAGELSIPYYCFSSWKKVALKAHEFSYHKKSGSTTLLCALLMILLTEAIALHFLLALWNTTVAWLMTLLTAYTFLQVIGLMRSMVKRPIEMTAKMLWLKYGTFADARIAWDDIDCILDYDRTKKIEEVVLLSPLGEMEYPNLHLRFKRPIVITAAFGMEKECMELLLFVDEKEQFKASVNHFLNPLNNDL